MALSLQTRSQNLPEPRYVRPHRSMKREFQFGFVSILIGLLTVTAIYCAWLNFQKEKEYAPRYAGAGGVERASVADAYGSRLYAKRVDEGGPAERAGVKVGDELLSVGGSEVKNSASLVKKLYKTG